MEFLYLIIGVVIVGTLAFIFQRYRRKKALKLIQLDSQKLTDSVMEASLKNLKLLNESLAASALISDVWGKGVIAFEYQLEVKDLTNADLNGLKKQLEQQLAVHAKAQGIRGYQQNRAFVVSDIWLKDGILHIDVSYLVNKATVEYVNDMNTLEQNN
ncbi:hypothetical protein QYH53_05715 [Ligilactobacillus animalis]|uniref:hypothetical protein n=1 Tax=Ligilactobacillus animalis TaxID=1605 RepID=UPI00242ADD9A|nr:hypothetical protein [Ligilactobacillus animalis]WKB73752.1 hypothetical protein QYH53_05715 [Ligilactobacillus animalis]